MMKKPLLNSLIAALIVQPLYRGLPVLFLALGLALASPSAAVAQPPELQKLETSISAIRNADELVLFYQNLAAIKNPTPQQEEALAGADFLAPLRNPKIPWSQADVEKIKKSLDSDTATEGPIDWQGLRLGFALTIDPARAKELLWNVLDTQKGLSNKFSWYESPVHRSFVNAVVSLPKSVRDSLMTDLMALRGERLRAFKKGEYKNHADEAQAKLGVRDIQFLQTLLVRQEFLATVRNLKTIYKKSGVNAEFLSKLDEYLLKLRLDPNPYSMQKVLETAQGMQSAMQARFAKEDSAEMFGSFPNLSANINSTDLDVVFSDALDAKVRTHIKTGGMAGNESFTTEEVEKMSAEGKEVAADLAAVEKQAAQILGVSKPQGKLLGPLILPMVKTDKGLVPRMSRLETMRFMTVISSVTVLITPQQIVLRIYDSISPAPGAAPVIYEFGLQ